MPPTEVASRRLLPSESALLPDLRPPNSARIGTRDYSALKHTTVIPTGIRIPVVPSNDDLGTVLLDRQFVQGDQPSLRHDGIEGMCARAPDPCPPPSVFLDIPAVATRKFIRSTQGNVPWTKVPIEERYSGFHDEPQCAAVCPVDCCLPDPEVVESKEQLLAKVERLNEIDPGRRRA